MDYTVIIPARMASSRLPDKPLADLAGLPMVVRVAQRAARSGARRVVVAADDARVLHACQAHGVQALLTRPDHASGSDRLAEASALLGLADEELVVNVQGDEPLIPPDLIDAVAAVLAQRPEASMGTAAHALHALDEFTNPNVVKVVTDAQGLAMYFSRAPIPWWRSVQAARSTCSPSRPVCAISLSLGSFSIRARFRAVRSRISTMMSASLRRTDNWARPLTVLV